MLVEHEHQRRVQDRLRDPCLWIDGARRDFCTSVSVAAQTCTFRLPQGFALADDTCTSATSCTLARGKLPLASVQLIALPAVRSKRCVFDSLERTGLVALLAVRYRRRTK